MTEHRVALVTGSSSGIGAAVARRLAADGVRVVVNSAHSAAAGKALAAELPDAVYLQANVAEEGEAARLVEGAVDAYGRLDRAQPYRVPGMDRPTVHGRVEGVRGAGGRSAGARGECDRLRQPLGSSVR
ncbi:MAG TPA: SDR family NAD(P)-dependent oxidoreductase [Streptomyces sp.]|nr:SDR family NAD(P)-dependent oxidoreductase [Streptomyces sp.]